jgi:hypothetical protein
MQQESIGQKKLTTAGKDEVRPTEMLLRGISGK